LAKDIAAGLKILHDNDIFHGELSSSSYRLIKSKSETPENISMNPSLLFLVPRIQMLLLNRIPHPLKSNI
ncbi:17490_t:CDS:2, partial [Entrophospora sp. SA101]